jgi:predicted transcriptional regulator
MSFSENDDDSGLEMLGLSSEIVAAFVAQNSLPADQLPDLIRAVHGALNGLNAPETIAPTPARGRPAVPISRSVQADYLVCLEDGKQLKMLKRYLRSRYGMTPDDYRRRWGLPPDYPMVAPGYAAKRSDFAKQIGLGRGVRSGSTKKR